MTNIIWLIFLSIEEMLLVGIIGVTVEMVIDGIDSTLTAV
jgi:hypothetical protein